MKYLEIDVNFSLGFTSDNGKAVNEIIDEGRRVELDGFSIRVPSEKHFFIHLCSHLWKEASTYPWVKMKRDMSLYKYCDIYFLMNQMSFTLAEDIIECAKKYNLEKECYCSIVHTKELFNETSVIYDFVLNKLNTVDPETINLVIYPAEKKIYKYIEKSAIQRLFSKNRCNLLKEVGEWNR